MTPIPEALRGAPPLSPFDLYARGLTVIPVRAPRRGVAKGKAGDGKTTDIAWKQYQEKRPEESDVRRWFDDAAGRPNVAVLTGRVSGVCVIDADSPRAEAWVTAHLPETPWRVKTGKGRHYYFKHPGVRVANSARIRTGEGRLELDVRGDGGYVIGPGSVHSNGASYAAEGDWSIRIAELPVLPVELLAEYRQAYQTRPAAAEAAPLPTAARLSVLERARRYLAAVPGAVEGQGGDSHTFSTACRLVRGFDLYEGEALSLLSAWNAGCVPPWTEDELREKVKNAMSYGEEGLGALKDAPPPHRPARRVEAGRGLDPDAPDAEKEQEPGGPRFYMERGADFLAEQDSPETPIVNELVVAGRTILLHGEPRARKTWAAIELVVAAATGTPAFGLERFAVSAAVPVHYAGQEDGRRDFRARLRRTLAGRGLKSAPAELFLSVHAGIDLESPEWHEALIRDYRSRGIRFGVFDPARRFSLNADKGPAEVRAMSAFLRRLTVETSAAVAVVHHDVKPGREEDNRRRGHRASGGDWFAASDCPIHLEPAGRDRTLVVPEDFKHGSDPASFSFRIEEDESRTWARVVAEDVAAADVSALALYERVLEFLRHNPGSTGNAVARGVRGGKGAILGALRDLSARDQVDSVEEKQSIKWFVRGGA